MLYSESRKRAVIAAYMGDLERLDKKLAEMSQTVKNLGTNAQKIWGRACISFKEKRRRFEEMLWFFDGLPPEVFQKEVGRLARKWGDCKHAFERGCADIEGEEPLENKKTPSRSWWGF